MSISKKKPAVRKAKPAKKPAARPIPPPPPGLTDTQIQDALAEACQKVLDSQFRPSCGMLDLDINRARDEEKKSRLAFAKEFLASLPIATQSATPQSTAPMIRLRLPSEKPTREDGGESGRVIVYCKGTSVDKLFGYPISWNHPWFKRASNVVVFWLPGDLMVSELPDGILPREPSQEEKWRAEFEAWWTETGHTDHNGLIAEAAWKGFLAAKKGGAE